MGAPVDPATSPTPNQIVLADGEVSLSHSCGGHGVVSLPRQLAFNLATQGKGETPIATLKFRCRKCGGLAEPIVTGPGNSLMGRAKLWPPG